MDFTIIEDLAALSAEDLAAYIVSATAAAASIVDNDEASIEDIQFAAAIMDSRDQAQAAIGALDAEASARAEALSAVRARVVEPEVVEVVEEEAAVVEPVVAAAPPRATPIVRAANRQRTVIPPEAEPRPLATIIAAADVPGLASGSIVASIRDLSVPAQAVLDVLNRASGETRIEKNIAMIRTPRTDGLVASARDTDLTDLLARAASESRLQGGSLIAAGGWCAPSETIYDLCEGETTDGLWDVPDIQVNRGGLSYTKGPQFADFYAGASISQTEAQAIAGTAKTFVTISCPTFVETRLDVIGVGISVPILTQSAYPELVSRWISGTLIAHQHRKSINLLNKALTITGAATSVANPWPTASGSILAAIELVVMGERQRYRLGLNTTLEATFPHWVKAAIRADLSQRMGVDMLQVTDAMIDAYFALRGVRAQYVYGWQDLTVSAGTPAVDYPLTLEILIYPAGTFVAGTKDVINISGVYDSTGLAANTGVALFTEEGISLMNFCWTPRRISLPLQVTGLTAGALINQDYGTVATTRATPNISPVS